MIPHKKDDRSLGPGREKAYACGPVAEYSLLIRCSGFLSRSGERRQINA